jgi:hypothetical protein
MVTAPVDFTEEFASLLAPHEVAAEGRPQVVSDFP